MNMTDLQSAAPSTAAPTAIAINCSLKPSGASSTDAMIGVLAEHFAKLGVTISETIRIAAHNVKWGVDSDMGEGDAWPSIRAKILAHDILIFGTPIWMGQASSVAKLCLERMDAFLSETDEQGRMRPDLLPELAGFPRALA